MHEAELLVVPVLRLELKDHLLIVFLGTCRNVKALRVLSKRCSLLIVATVAALFKRRATVKRKRKFNRDVFASSVDARLTAQQAKF